MDFLATKGIEYLLAIGYLLLLIPVWWFFQRAAPRLAPAGDRERSAPWLPARSWFAVPEGFHFHRGHTWAQPEWEGPGSGNLVRVGLDDFAQRLLGPPTAVRLPEIGTRVEQGEPGLNVQVNGNAFDLLSPVQGEVVEVNQEAIREPELVSDDPFGKGWLLKVRVPSRSTALKNLLPGRLAQAWMEEAAERIDSLVGGELGAVLQDGGLPVAGFGRQLAGERWPELAEELLLTRSER